MRNKPNQATPAPDVRELLARLARTYQARAAACQQLSREAADPLDAAQHAANAYLWHARLCVVEEIAASIFPTEHPLVSPAKDAQAMADTPTTPLPVAAVTRGGDALGERAPLPLPTLSQQRRLAYWQLLTHQPDTKHPLIDYAGFNYQELCARAADRCLREDAELGSVLIVWRDGKPYRSLRVGKPLPASGNNEQRTGK